MNRTSERFFIAGGALPYDAPSYVVRRADTALYTSLRAGEFCYILDTRQSGKSSLKVRIAAHLRHEGFSILDLDMTRIGQPSLPDQWYYGLLLDIGDQLNLIEPLQTFWRAHKTEIGPLQCWLMALRKIVLEQLSAPLILFIDEIDAVRSLSFSTDEFFAGIRECYHRRAQDPAYERLTFCLLGVAAPSDLIRDGRTTPFNIGRRIELNDFTLEETAPLAEGLIAGKKAGKLNEEATEDYKEGDFQGGRQEFKKAGGEASETRKLLERVLYWTGGHPYLTQRLCRAIAESIAEPAPRASLSAIGSKGWDALHPAPAIVDGLCAELFLTARARETDDNLTFVWNRILRGNGDVAALLTLYRQVWSGRPVRDESSHPLITDLKLAGIVRVEEGMLQVRNRIYAREFDAAWVRENMPDAEVQRQRAAYRRGILRASSIYGTIALVICGLALATLRQKQLADLLARHARTSEAHARTEAARANQEAANARRQLYFANMELAPREWENSRIGHLQQLLDETKDNENRNWEWNYWNRLSHLERIAIPAYGRITSVAISPDGGSLAIPYQSGVKVYEAATAREIRYLGDRGQDLCLSAAFSSDGKRIATGNKATARIWEARTGRLLLTLRGHPDPIVTISYASSGNRLLTASSDTYHLRTLLKVWDADTGRSLLSLPTPGRDAASISLSPDGRRVVIGGEEGRVQVWDVASGRQTASWTGGASTIASTACSPDGRSVVTGGLDGVVRVQEMATGREILRLKHATDHLVGATFSPDGRRLLTSCSDGTAKIWEAQSGRLLLTLRHASDVNFTAFFPDGGRVVTISGKDSGMTVRVWDAWNDRRALRLRAHRGFVIGMAFSPDGRRLVTSGGDRIARIWEVATGRKLLELQGHTSDIYSVAYSPDGRHILTGSDDSTAIVWDSITGKSLFMLKAAAGRVNAVAWSLDGRRIATAHADKIAAVWNAESGRQIGVLRGHNGQVLGVSFAPDSMRLVTASADGAAKIWDAVDCREIHTVEIAHGYWLWSVAFSPDGRRIVLGCQDDTAKVCDLVNGDTILTLQGHIANVHVVAFSQDGKRIVTGSHDGTMRMWDTATERETLLLEHPHAVYSLAFSPDKGHLATGGLDGTVYLWNAAN